MTEFNPSDLKKLYVPPVNSNGEDNGQLTIIGGSKLFHGAPILSLKAASRMVDMVFFASPEPSIVEIANHLKSQLASFIWVPWDDVNSYISKSDAVLIGPGLMRFSSETRNSESGIRNGELDEEGKKTRDITKRLLEKFPDKKWVIDAGSLQTMEADWIPKGAVITPNRHEFEILFGDEIEEIPHKVLASQSSKSFRDDTSGFKSLPDVSNAEAVARKYKCTIVYKGPETIVTNGDETVVINGGNAGLTKGGTGDTLAGLTVALLAKNDALLAASAATFILKKAAEDLEEKVGTNFNADDVAEKLGYTYHKYV